MARKKSASNKSPTPGDRDLVLRRRVPLEVPQASGVALFAPGRFLVVDDNKGIFAADEAGRAALLRSGKCGDSMHDLEGITIDRNRGLAILVCEKGGSVQSVPLSDKTGAPELGTPQPIGKLPSIGREDNKGWEGVAWIPDGALAPGEFLLAVHERKPKRLGIFTYPALETRVLLELPRQAKDAMRDLSDLAFDPKTGHVWILSDESRCLVDLALDGLGGDEVSLEVSAIHPLDVGKRQKPEGVCIEGDALWLVTDGEPFLYDFALRRA